MPTWGFFDFQVCLEVQMRKMTYHKVTMRFKWVGWSPIPWGCWADPHSWQNIFYFLISEFMSHLNQVDQVTSLPVELWSNLIHFWFPPWRLARGTQLWFPVQPVEISRSSLKTQIRMVYLMIMLYVTSYTGAFPCFFFQEFLYPTSAFWTSRVSSHWTWHKPYHEKWILKEINVK